MREIRVTNQPFWETKTLDEMTEDEWESLCDGCARCCTLKLEDDDTGEIHFTGVVCRLLDQDSCRCTRYSRRHELVPDCVRMNSGNIANLGFLPRSCAYRRVAEHRGLAWWHPLISGREETVHEAGISVLGKVVSEQGVHPDDLENHIVRWVEL